MIIIHLVHEAPPDKMAGIGRWVYSFVNWNACKEGIKHVPVAMSFSAFSNYVYSDVDYGVYRTNPRPDPLSYSFVSNIEEQNEKLFRLVEKLVCREAIDNEIVLHCHDWLCWLAAKELKELYNWPVVFTVHSVLKIRKDCGFLEFPDEESEDYAINLQQEAVEQADFVTVFNKKSYEDLVLISEGKLNKEVVPLGLDLKSNFSERTMPRCIKIGFIGRLALEKGCKLLAPMVEGLGITAELIIAGDGPYKSELINELQERNIPFRYLGYVHEIDSFFEQVDILVIPSLYDPGPLTAIESLLHKTPVVISNRCGIVDHLLECEGSVIVASPDENEFSEAVVQLMNSRNAWNEKLSHTLSVISSGDLNVASTERKLSYLYWYLLNKIEITKGLESIKSSIPPGIHIESVYVFGSVLSSPSYNDIDFFVVVDKWCSEHQRDFLERSGRFGKRVSSDFSLSINEEYDLHVLFLTNEFLDDISPLFAFQVFNNGICLFGYKIISKRPSINDLLNSEGGIESLLYQIENQVFKENFWDGNSISTHDKDVGFEQLDDILKFAVKVIYLNCKEFDFDADFFDFPLVMNKDSVVQWINKKKDFLNEFS